MLIQDKIVWDADVEKNLAFLKTLVFLDIARKNNSITKFTKETR